MDPGLSKIWPHWTGLLPDRRDASWYFHQTTGWKVLWEPVKEVIKWLIYFIKIDTIYQYILPGCVIYTYINYSISRYIIYILPECQIILVYLIFYLFICRSKLDSKWNWNSLKKRYFYHTKIMFLVRYILSIDWIWLLNHFFFNILKPLYKSSKFIYLDLFSLSNYLVKLLFS